MQPLDLNLWKAGYPNVARMALVCTVDRSNKCARTGEVHLVPKHINYIAPFAWKSRSSPLPKGAGPCLLGDYWVRFAWV